MPIIFAGAAAGLGIAASSNGGLFGSAPSVNNTAFSTISPQQQELLGGLLPILLNGQTPAGINGTQFGAPLSPLQMTSLAGLENLVPGASNNPLQGQATSTLANILSQGNNPATNAFETGVAQPLIKNFNEQVIPAIEGQYGRSAGGAFSSDALKARQQAGTNLAETLAGAGAQYQLANNAQLINAANSVPALTDAPILQLAQLLAAGGVPQQTQQTQLTGQNQAIQQRISDLISAFAPQTMNTNTVVNPGSPGLVSQLLPLLAAFA